MGHITGLFQVQQNDLPTKQLYGLDYVDSFFKFESIQLQVVVSSRNNDHDRFFLKRIDKEDHTNFIRGFKLDEEDNGSFSSIRVGQDRCTLEVDFLGIGRWFYYQKGPEVYFSTSLWALRNLLINQKIYPEVDEQSLWSLAALGMLPPNKTVYKDVFIVQAYQRIVLKASNSSPIHIEAKDDPFLWGPKDTYSLDRIALAFNGAVSSMKQFSDFLNKPMLAGLSGGLDSRMSVFSYEKQFGSIDTLTFSQPGTLDDLIADKIATDLNLKRHFVSLEKGEYLNHLDHWKLWNKWNDGTNLTFQSAHALYAYNKIDVSSYSLMLTGQLGDAIISRMSFTQNDWIKDIKKASIGFFPQYLSRLDYISTLRKMKPTDSFPELWKLRLINGALHGDRITSELLASYSPYYSRIIWEETQAIGQQKLLNYRFYIPWMKLQDERALNYKWEKINAKPSTYSSFIFNKYRHAIEKRIFKKTSMNPFDLWFQQNPILKDKYSNQIQVMQEKHVLLNELFGDIAVHSLSAVQLLALFNIFGIYDQYVVLCD